MTQRALRHWPDAKGLDAGRCPCRVHSQNSKLGHPHCCCICVPEQVQETRSLPTPAGVLRCRLKAPGLCWKVHWSRGDCHAAAEPLGHRGSAAASSTPSRARRAELTGRPRGPGNLLPLRAATCVLCTIKDPKELGVAAGSQGQAVGCAGQLKPAWWPGSGQTVTSGALGDVILKNHLLRCSVKNPSFSSVPKRVWLVELNSRHSLMGLAPAPQALGPENTDTGGRGSRNRSPGQGGDSVRPGPTCDTVSVVVSLDSPMIPERLFSSSPLLSLPLAGSVLRR